MEGLFIFESCVSICIIHFSIRPSKSVSELIIWNFRFSLKSIATPDAFGVGPECQGDFPFHSFSHLLLTSGVVWVSCMWAISIFLLYNV